MLLRTKRARTIVLAVGLVIAGGLGLLTYSCSVSSGFDTRWNYYRAGPFALNTPAISRDGSIVVFDSAVSGNGDIYLARHGTLARRCPCFSWVPARRLLLTDENSWRSTTAPRAKTKSGSSACRKEKSV